jgi:hypothetical protein
MFGKTWKKMAMAVMPAMLVAIVAAGDVQADPVLNVTNGMFTKYSGVTPGTSGDNFQNVNPDGWVGGGGLIFVTTANGTKQIGVNDPNLYLQVYGPTPNQTASPTNPISNPIPGSNFVEADGNPDFENSFSYTQLSGLTKNQEYQISFWVAYGQQTGFTGDMTNQWIVGLGKQGSQFTFTSNGNGTDSYHYSDPNGSVTTTPLTSVKSGHFSGWSQVTVFLTADAPDDVLTFLAWGNNGSTINVPPIAFLDIGANGDVTATPEPASLSLMVIGMFGVGAYRLRRRRAKLATI